MVGVWRGEGVWGRGRASHSIRPDHPATLPSFLPPSLPPLISPSLTVDGHGLLRGGGEVAALVLGELHLALARHLARLRVVPHDVHGEGAVGDHHQAAALALRHGRGRPGACWRWGLRWVCSLVG